MKLKTCLPAVLFIALLSVSKTSSAQFYLGPKVAYNNIFDMAGGGLEMGTITNEKYKFGIDAIYYIPKEASVGFGWASESVKYTFMEVNANFSYLLPLGSANVYPIGGMQAAFVAEEVKQSVYGYSTNVSYKDTYIGFNLGAGLRMNRAGRVSPSIEFKYAISGYNNMTLAFVLPINFKKAE